MIKYQHVNTLGNERILCIASIGILVITTVSSVFIFLHAGVVRDVPELDLYFANAHRGMHKEYNDKIYDMDMEFPDNNRTNILVIGNSFARDMANILLESEIATDINLSYSYGFDEGRLRDRVKNSDRILVYLYKSDIPEWVYENMKSDAEIYGIGTKNFGQSNGIIYKNRFRYDYFLQTIVPDEEWIVDNEKRKEEWGDKYIDIMEASKVNANEVRIFSDTNKFLSQDCRHLTRAGAIYFSHILKYTLIEITDNS